jgi:hypothetical protein
MKNKIRHLVLLFITISIFACLTPKPSILFKVDEWKTSNLSLFDSLVRTNSSVIENGLTNQNMVRKKITNLSTSLVNTNLQYILRKNNNKKWSKLYILINSFEGEVIIDITTFLFESEGYVWGYSYSNNLNKYRKVNKFDMKEIARIKSIVHSSNNNVLIISKFDKNFNEFDKQILIGTGFREFQTILNLYNEEIL